MTVSREKSIVIASLSLVAATLAFYNPIVRNQFVDFDNLAYILKNPHVQRGLTWETVKWSFTTFYQANWHPLTWMSHALDCQLYGINPLGHHYTNLLLHAANAVLLFLLLRRATGFTWSSLFVATLFALHPVNVESVAWAAERKNVLSMLFFLLTLHAYDRYARTGLRSLYWLVTALFTLGLMAKPQIVTLPFVLLLWDYWPLQRMGALPAAGLPETPTARSFGYLVWEKWPLFILAAADSVVTVIAQRGAAAVRTLSEVPVSWRLENVFVSYERYIGKAFWPSRLAPMYPRSEHALSSWQVAGAAALLILISALVLRWRAHRYLPVGWFWFLGTLVPMIGIVTVGEQSMADRYAYLPFIGLFVAVAWTLDEAASKRGIRDWLAVPALALLVIMGCLTYRQVGYWRNDETLWRYTLGVTERNYTAHNNLALGLLAQGRTEEAIVQFRASTALHNYAPAQVLALAVYELQAGHALEAIEECNTVVHVSADPKVQAAAWSGMGQAYLQLQDYDQAAASYQNALRLNPNDGGSLIGTGLLALRRGQSDLAVAQFYHAVKVEPTDANVLLFAQALRRAGRAAEADSAAAQVTRISSDLAQAQSDAGHMLSYAGLKPL
jgi:tetratricopeptide (TPR) repeat protein